DVEHHDLAPEQHHRSAIAIVAVGRIFKVVDPAQGHAPFVIARRPQAAEGHRVVEQLHAFTTARELGRGATHLARLDRVEPEPGERTQRSEKDDLEEGHRRHPGWNTTPDEAAGVSRAAYRVS